MIKYPSLFNLKYKNDISNNIVEQFHLECLNISKLKLWKDVFSLDLSDNIIINYENITKLFSNLQTCFKGHFHFTGKSFTNNPILRGDIPLYYNQYIAHKIFNNSLNLEPFKNIKNINLIINNQIENILHQIFNKNNPLNIPIKKIIKLNNTNIFLTFKIQINNNNNFKNIDDTLWYLHLFIN